MNSPLLTPLASNARLTDARVGKVELIKEKTEFQTRSAVGSNIDNFIAGAPPDLIERTTVWPSQPTRSRSVSGADRCGSTFGLHERRDAAPSAQLAGRRDSSSK